MVGCLAANVIVRLELSDRHCSLFFFNLEGLVCLAGTSSQMVCLAYICVDRCSAVGVGTGYVKESWAASAVGENDRPGTL